MRYIVLLTIVILSSRITDGLLTAVIYTPEGLNVNLEMVCRGAAWRYERCARGDTELGECQESARETNLGLWDGDPVAPWEWRRK